MKFLTSILFGVSAAAFVAGESTVYVAPAGSDTNPGTKTEPFRTVSHAVSAVGADGTVYVNPGVYTKMPTFNDAGISVLAYPETNDNPADTHVFSGLNKYPSNYVVVNKNGTTIKGFGFRQSQGYASVYGAVYVATFGGVHIEDCEFTDNTVGLSVLSGSATLENCHFNTATTSNGAGTAVNMMYNDFGGGGRVSATNCKFDGPGTAFNLRDGPTSVNVTDSEFTNLRVGFSAGYVSRNLAAQVKGSHFDNVTQAFNFYGMQSPGKAVVDIHSCTFEHGGGDAVDGAAVKVGQDVSFTIEDSNFTGHHGKQGSVINCGDQASISVIGSRFDGNSAEDGSPGWCSKSCGFVSSKNEISRNEQKKDTGACAGLTPTLTLID